MRGISDASLEHRRQEWSRPQDAATCAQGEPGGVALHGLHVACGQLVERDGVYQHEAVHPLGARGGEAQGDASSHIQPHDRRAREPQGGHRLVEILRLGGNSEVLAEGTVRFAVAEHVDGEGDALRYRQLRRN